MFSFILNILFPPRCLACGVDLFSYKSNWSYLCPDCFGSIPIESGFSCPLCKNRLPEPKNPCHPETKYVLAAATSYQNAAVRETIHALKYRSIKKAVAPLSEILNSYLKKIIGHLSLIISNSIIIPVPLHRGRERRRGYNQSFLLAEELACLLNKKYIEVRLRYVVRSDVLIKLKATKPQVELDDKADRRQNIQNSFTIIDELAVKGKNIILVDDIFTSGATLNEAVRVLKSAGAKKIIAFVIAKA